MHKRSAAKKISCRLWLLVAGVTLLTLGLLFHARYSLTIVSGESMEPTLKSGDILLVDKRAYSRLDPDRGDIVVARYYTDWIVKRVVGLPGEQVELRDGRLYVDGNIVTEHHQLILGRLDVGKGTLMDGDFATLGDNRAIVPALAIHPIVTKADILGKVVLSLSLRDRASIHRLIDQPEKS